MSSKKVSVVCGVMLAMSALPLFGAVNGWNEAAGSGLWSNAGNWWNGQIPNAAETLYITNNAQEGLTVTLDGEYVSTATNTLYIGNKSGATNTLVITGSFIMERKQSNDKYQDIVVTKGGRIELVEGGEIVRHRGSYGEYNSTDDWAHYVIGLSGGGEFHQTGGFFAITNQSRQGISIGDKTGSITSRYVMTSGRMRWEPQVLGYSSFTIFKTGRLEIGGNAKVEFYHDNEKYRRDEFNMRGGVFDLHGNAEFLISNKTYFTFGYGSTFVRNNAKIQNLDNWGTVLVSPNNSDSEISGATAEISIQDNAVFNPVGNNGSFIIGLRRGTRSIVNVGTTGYVNLGKAFLYAGCNAGYGELNLNGPGYTAVGGYSGLHIGSDDLSNAGTGIYSSSIYRDSIETAAPTGVVNMTGGTLSIGGNASEAWGYQYLMGLIVGAGSRARSTLTDPFESRLFRGEFNLSGGIVTNKAYLVVGAGRATGRMVQTDGFLYMKAENKTSMVVGCAGGHGEYALSNGTLNVMTCLHVGGATTNQLDRKWAKKAGFPCTGNYPSNRHDAQGRFTVACADKAKTCKLYVKDTITVSSDGAGLFEVVGSGADISAKNMIVSNDVSAVEGGESIVKFTLDEDGVSPIELSGKLSVASGAKLIVDMSGLSDEVNSATLFTFDSLERGFDQNCISVEGGWGRIAVNESDITFKRILGTHIIIR